ncbi:MAG: hypothetical protein HRT89_13845, partial [Lentisphaeria bacterium]|nr:hypothetical protein [Lentisphaeria bacterium]
MNVVSSDFFAKNLQFIEGLSSEASYSALQETGPSDLQYKDGSYIICKEDRDLALHSRQSPQDQAQRQIKRWIMQHSTALENLTVIFGCAGFYHVREFLKESYGSSYLLIVDNHPAHVRTLLENQDLSDLYSKGKICFIINANPRACVFEYSELIKTIPSINISFYVQPAIYRIYQENYDLLMDLFTKATKIEGMNRGTAASFSDEWLQNSLINLAYML